MCSFVCTDKLHDLSVFCSEDSPHPHPFICLPRVNELHRLFVCSAQEKPCSCVSPKDWLCRLFVFAFLVFLAAFLLTRLSIHEIIIIVVVVCKASDGVQSW
jgi:hypothetical protein